VSRLIKALKLTGMRRSVLRAVASLPFCGGLRNAALASRSRQEGGPAKPSLPVMGRNDGCATMTPRRLARPTDTDVDVTETGTRADSSALKSQMYGPARCSVRLSYARFLCNAGDFPSRWEAADKHRHRFPRYPLIIRWTQSRRAPTITVRPNEESRSGGLADFKWSSLRI